MFSYLSCRVQGADIATARAPNGAVAFASTNFRIADRDGFGWSTKPTDHLREEIGERCRQPSAMAIAAGAMQACDMRPGSFPDHDEGLAAHATWNVFRPFELNA
jgi:hypothetical protein